MSGNLNKRFIPIEAEETWTGTFEEVRNNIFAIVTGKTDTTGIVYVDHSTNSQTVDFTNTFYVQADTEFRFVASIDSKFIRLRFTNTSESNQTYLRVVLRLVAVQPNIGPTPTGFLSINNTFNNVVVNTLEYLNGTIDPSTDYSQATIFYTTNVIPAYIYLKSYINGPESHNHTQNIRINDTSGYITIPIFTPNLQISYFNPNESDDALVSLSTIFQTSASDERYPLSTILNNKYSAQTSRSVLFTQSEHHQNIVPVVSSYDNRLQVDLPNHYQTLSGLSTTQKTKVFDLALEHGIRADQFKFYSRESEIEEAGIVYDSNGFRLVTNYPETEAILETRYRVPASFGTTVTSLMTASLGYNVIFNDDNISFKFGTFDAEYGAGFYYNVMDNNINAGVFLRHTPVKHIIRLLLNGTPNSSNFLNGTLTLNDIPFEISQNNVTSLNQVAELITSLDYYSFVDKWDVQQIYNNNILAVEFISVDPRNMTGNHSFETEDGEVTGLVANIREGSNADDVDFIHINQWFDRCDGSGNPETNPSNFELDWLDMNLYKIEYTLTGIRYYIMDPAKGKFVFVAEMSLPPSSSQTIMKKMSLPFRAEIFADGSGFYPSASIGISGMSSYIDDKTSPTGYKLCKSISKTINVSNSLRSIMGIRTKNILNDLYSNKQIKIIGISVATEGTKPVEFGIYSNPTYYNENTNHPVWIDASSSSSQSCALIETNATAFLGGTCKFGFNLGKSSDKFIDLTNDNLIVYAGTTLCLAAKCIDSSTVISASIYWIELP